MSYPYNQRTIGVPNPPNSVTPIKPQTSATSMTSVKMLQSKLMEDGMEFTQQTGAGLTQQVAAPTGYPLLPRSPPPMNGVGASFGGWTMSQVSRDIANQQGWQYASPIPYYNGGGGYFTNVPTNLPTVMMASLAVPPTVLLAGTVCNGQTQHPSSIEEEDHSIVVPSTSTTNKTDTVVPGTLTGTAFFPAPTTDDTAAIPASTVLDLTEPEAVDASVDNPVAEVDETIREPTFSFLSENRTVVSRSEWNRALQEEVFDNANLERSKKVNYPNMFKVVTAYADKWRLHSWHGPATNITNFKYRVMNYILLQRSKPQPVTQHMDVVESIITQARIRGKDTDECKATIVKRGTVLVMPQDLFLDYAIRNYRLDVVGSMKQRDCHSINDILRLFSVMAMNDHRADVLSLSSHKVSNRSQMDQAFGREDMIFLRISKDFNNSSVQVQPPKLFHTLTEKVTMNPNAISDSKKNGLQSGLNSYTRVS